MAEKSEISWTDATFNPWIGCTKVSAACDFCYAEARSIRFGDAELWRGKLRRTSPSNWRQPFKWDREAAAAGIQLRVFCASLADVFDNQAPIEWLRDLLEIIRQTTNLDWLLLTKRPQNIQRRLTQVLGAIIETGAGYDEIAALFALANWLRDWLSGSPPANVWLGTTTENQEEADRRIPILLEVPARLHFISAEPLLGPVELDRTWLWGENYPEGHRPPGGPACIGLVIAGGESGPHARPMNPAWPRRLRDQSAANGIPFHFKQWGEYVSVSEVAGPGEHYTFDDGSTVRRVGKKTAGRRLDGREWTEMPA